MYKNYNSLKDDFAYDLLFTINKNDQLEFNDETRGHLRNLLVAGILSLKFIEISNTTQVNYVKSLCG